LSRVVVIDCEGPSPVSPPTSHRYQGPKARLRKEALESPQAEELWVLSQKSWTASRLAGSGLHSAPAKWAHRTARRAWRVRHASRLPPAATLASETTIAPLLERCDDQIIESVTLERAARRVSSRFRRRPNCVAVLTFRMISGAMVEPEVKDRVGRHGQVGIQSA
jgi:hypothetical protein